MKKTLTLILSMLLVLALCVSAGADELPWTIKASTGLIKLASGTNVAGMVTIPAEVEGTSVVGLDYMAFKSTFDVTEMIFPDTIRFFESNTLDNSPYLASLTLPRDLLIIKDGSLSGMPIESLVIPPSVSVIDGAIFNLSNIKSITFEGVCPIFPVDSYYTTFADLAAECVIYVPDDQIDAYKAAFAEREDVLARIQPSGKNAVQIDWTAPESDFDFDASTGTITAYNGTAGRIEIPATIGGTPVKAIGKQAFLQRYSLCYVTIPEGVETIEKQAFHGCSLMTYVSLPTTLKTIGDSAFNTNKLAAVGWAEGLESIGSKAFYNCDLEFVTLPTTLKTIAASGFERAGMVEVTFGPSVESVGEKGFSGNRLTKIVYTGMEMPEFGADAFKDNKYDATLTLADGCPKELYEGFVTYMADAFAKCVVSEPTAMEMPFPALDVMAGMPFFGSWHAVAGKDVMGDFTDAYPSVNATLNPDGTAVVILDGVEMPSGWYVEAGSAFLAAAENGKPDAAATYAMANIDENGRLVIDFFYAAAICEQEGKLYTAPAVPEKPWPEFNLDNAKYFIGAWQTADGAMTLTLNDDGTATSAEMGEEPYALQWYADYGTAYVGPAMSELAKITFDGNGNIKMSMGGDEIILVPYVEKKLIEGADELLGDWYDDIGTKLTLTNEGALTLTYDDGYAREMTWNVVDGQAMVTSDIWESCPITFDGIILTITNGEGIFQLFSRDGDLSAYYGSDAGYELPEAMPIGSEGEPYFGAWTADMGGMQMTLTLNPDGTCGMEMFGEVDPGVWMVIDGKANVMGDELYINGEGQLVMESQGMVFVRGEGSADGEEMSEDEMLLALLEALAAMEEGESGVPEHLQGYLGEWHMVYMNFGGMSGHPKTVLGLDSKFTVNEDGTASVGFPIDKNGNWYEEDGNVYFGEEGMPLTLLSDGCLQYGSQLGGYFVFSKDPNATWEPTAGQAMTLAPGVSNLPGATAQAQSAGFTTMEERLEKKFVAKTYTSFGQTMDASMLGAEYAVTFHANGLADFTLSGMTVPSLPWGLQKVAVGLTSVDAFAINYYGSMFNAVLTDAGFDMDYYGTMTLHFVLAE
ncbi:MAG: leucine-rich repeat protein [Clostridia bacterium]|nr:leucine-rich repeat protein [Clostridia bacterium]